MSSNNTPPLQLLLLLPQTKRNIVYTSVIFLTWKCHSLLTWLIVGRSVSRCQPFILMCELRHIHFLHTAHDRKHVFAAFFVFYFYSCSVLTNWIISHNVSQSRSQLPNIHFLAYSVLIVSVFLENENDSLLYLFVKKNCWKFCGVMF